MTSRVLFGFIAAVFCVAMLAAPKAEPRAVESGAVQSGAVQSGAGGSRMADSPTDAPDSRLAGPGTSQSRATDGNGAIRGSEPRAVVELFTSQGCSSCPAADRLLAELQADPAYLPLSLPIDYWDYLGWKDTLALPGHRSRQKAYAQMRGDRDIYTPQAVINGVAQAIGSDRTAIANALAQSYANAAPLSVPVSVAVSRERVEVALPERPGAAPGEVWLCPLSASVAVGIGRGENRGRTVTYTNVVRRWIKLGSWSGHGESFSVPVDALTFEGIDSVVVIVQNGSQAQPGAIVGASLAALRQAAE